MTIFGKIIVGAVLIVIGAGVYYGITSYVRGDIAAPVAETPLADISTTTEESPLLSASTTSATTTVATSTIGVKNGKKIPFTDLMSKGGSYKCTVTQTMANMTSEGAVYLHGKLVRAEFTNSLAGQTINTTMIARDGYNYSWTNTTSGKGTKVKIASSGADLNATSTTYTWNGSQVGDYTCSAWVADDTMFELPKSVTFTLQ